MDKWGDSGVEQLIGILSQTYFIVSRRHDAAHTSHYWLPLITGTCGLFSSLSLTPLSCIDLQVRGAMRQLVTTAWAYPCVARSHH